MKDNKKYIAQLKGVSYHYPRQDGELGELALNGVDLDIVSGEFLSVIGRNGSGKSTLAKLLNALYTPTAGTVLVGGMDTSVEENVFKIRATAGMVFQNPDNQLVASVVEEDVAFALENLGIEPKEIRARVDEALSEMRMSEYAKKSPHMLSGGQKQRVALSGVFAMRPRMIILDEPTAMLDPEGRAEVMQSIKRLNSAYGITIVFITHYMEEALQSDRMAVLSKGRVALFDAPYKVFQEEAHLNELGLSIPFEAQLARVLSGAGIETPRNLDMEEMSKTLCRLLPKT